MVGDPDQSVYRWRGADLRNILEFEKDYPDCRVIALEQNYRSTKRILEIASHVIANNKARKDKRLWTENGEGDKAAVYRAWDENEESGFVAQFVRGLRREGVDYRDVAVFYRTNAQSRVMEDALRRASIPYLIVGGVRFYERREIKDVVAYLRLIVNPFDDVAFRRAVAAPTRGVGKATLDRLGELARASRASLLAACAHLPPDFGTKPRKALEDFARLIARLAERRATAAVARLHRRGRLRLRLQATRSAPTARPKGPRGSRTSRSSSPPPRNSSPIRKRSARPTSGSRPSSIRSRSWRTSTRWMTRRAASP